MTPAQRYKYFAEAKEAVSAMRERGHGGTDSELRHQLTFEALGHDKASADFTNREFDRVLAVLWSHAHAGDLAAQLRQIEQPIRRMEWLCKQHLRAAGVQEHGLNWYLLSMVKRMFTFDGGIMLSLLTEEQWRDVWSPATNTGCATRSSTKRAALDRPRFRRDGAAHPCRRCQAGQSRHIGRGEGLARRRTRRQGLAPREGDL